MLKTTTNNNRLLAALSKKDYKNMLPKLERVSLDYDATIYEAGAVIRHVYFPDSGIISLLTRVDNRSSMEVGIVGNEGMVGLTVLLGVKTSANLAVVQGPGFAERMKTADFLNACKVVKKMHEVLLRFMHSLITQISQSAACNRFHPVVERLARWLLMTQDRMQESEFAITQEFLSNMLGVRREAVTKAAGDLQRLKLISYTRGNLMILDRTGLEKAACACYAIIKKEYESALP